MDHGKNSGSADAGTESSVRRGRGRPREVVRRSAGKGLPLTHGLADYQPTTRSILDAAYRLVLRDGAKNLTLVAVAREAHVDVTTVSYHFGTRVGLIEGLMDVLYRAPVAAFAEGLGRLSTTKERVDAYFACVRLMTADRDSSRVYFEISTLALRDDALRARLRQFNRWVVEAFMGGIHEETTTPEQQLASTLTWAVVDGIDLHHAIGGGDYPAEEVLQLFERLITPMLADERATPSS